MMAVADAAGLDENIRSCSVDLEIVLYSHASKFFDDL